MEAITMFTFGRLSLIAGVLLSFMDVSTSTCINGTKTIFPGNCKKFYLCENGIELEKACPPSEIFHPVLSECGFSNTEDCSVISSQGMRLLSICTDGIKLPVHGNCEKFSECVNGQFEVKKCGMFQKFDPALLECRFFYQINCDATPGSGLSQRMSVCVSGTRIPVKEDCKKYDECVNGQYEQRTCKFLDKFDPAALQCRISIPFQEVNCSAIPGSYVFTTMQPMTEPAMYSSTEESICADGTRVPVDCSRYKECVNGQYQEEKCPLFESFDPEILKCRISLPFSQVNCSVTPSYTTSSPRDPTYSPGTEGPVCVDGTRFPVRGTCDQYFECVNGQYQEKMCNTRQVFDPEMMKCRMSHPSDADCRRGTFIPRHTTPSYTYSPTRGTETPRCVDGTKIPVENDCQKYVECVNGQYEEKECNYYQNFDPKMMECRSYYDFDCGLTTIFTFSTPDYSATTEPNTFEANGFNNIFIKDVVVLNNTFNSFYYLNKT